MLSSVISPLTSLPHPPLPSLSSTQVLLALNCVHMLVQNFGDNFNPLINMTFDTLLTKFIDTKVSIRAKAMNVMVSVITLMGLSTGLDRLMANHAHRNVRIRENMLATLDKVLESTEIDVYDMKTTNTVITKVAVLLNDKDTGVRQQSMDILAKLSNIFGESLMV